MTVMTAEFLPPAGNTVISQNERNFVRHGGTPSNWRIWIGRYKREKWRGHLVRQSIPVGFGEEKPKLTDAGHYWPNTQCSTFVAGQLYVTTISSVVRWLPLRWRFNETSRTLLREVWPIKSRIIPWPPLEKLADRDAIRIASAFANKITSAGKFLGLPPG